MSEAAPRFSRPAVALLVLVLAAGFVAVRIGGPALRQKHSESSESSAVLPQKAGDAVPGPTIAPPLPEVVGAGDGAVCRVPVVHERGAVRAGTDVTEEQREEKQAALSGLTRDFRLWLENHPGPVDPAGAGAEARALLEARRGPMAWMVRHEPRFALSQSFSYAERERLPEEWMPIVEERFSEIASVQILPDCSPGAHGAPPRILLERADGALLRGLAWGKLTGYRSKDRLPVEGIAMDGWAALAENGMRPVSGRELAAVERIFPRAPDSPRNATRKPVAALVAGRVRHFATEAEAREFRDLCAEVAALPGPRSAEPLVAALADDGDAGEAPSPSPEDIRRAARDEADSWTETPKSVLLINTVFPDRTTPVATQAEWQTTLGDVSDWLSENSFGKTNLVVTVAPDVFTLPSPVSDYEPGGDYPRILTDAKALALAAGYDSGNFDITIVAFPHLEAWHWSGRASLGGGNQWLNGNHSRGVVAHELGHNYGLQHASSWDADDGTVLPADGAPADYNPQHTEYGDIFSVMGSSGSYPEGHFSPHAKAELNWIVPSQVETVTTPGTYRIHRFDDSAEKTAPLLALKLQRAASQTFWLGYRRNFTDNTDLNNGAYVIWQYNPHQCRLLDMTPDSRTSSSRADKEDAALKIGQTFVDPTHFLYVTPVAHGGTPPDEWLDVRVEFTVAGNHDPNVVLQFPSNPIPLRSEVAFSATASDPDGDPLTYVWDFGNGRTATGSQVSWTFLAGGTRHVSLRVSDGKGGLAEIGETIEIADPLAELEEVDLPGSGRLNDGIVFNGLNLGVGRNFPVASPDGTSWRRGGGLSEFEPFRIATGAGRAVVVSNAYG